MTTSSLPETTDLPPLMKTAEGITLSELIGALSYALDQRDSFQIAVEVNVDRVVH